MAPQDMMRTCSRCYGPGRVYNHRGDLVTCPVCDGRGVLKLSDSLETPKAECYYCGEALQPQIQRRSGRELCTACATKGDKAGEER